MKIVLLLLLCLLGIVGLIMAPQFDGKGIIMFALAAIALGVAALDRVGDRWL